jgi:hypothetical protein
MRRAAGYASLASIAAAAVLFALQTPPLAAGSFADEIASLSEPEGTFDTDNLISNERSYLDVVPALLAGGVNGGAYVGVGPDQNFSYIARIRPSVAYIIDIRRDNLLLHLLFKALFARAPDRVSYLALLTGRSPPLLPANAGAEEVVRAIADARVRGTGRDGNDHPRLRRPAVAGRLTPPSAVFTARSSSAGWHCSSTVTAGRRSRITRRFAT